MSAPTPLYDRAVPSDGLTLDGPHGPVDLVAVERALCGQPTALTYADRAHAIALLPDGTETHVDPAARGLGISPASVRRAVQRRNQRDRTRP